MLNIDSSSAPARYAHAAIHTLAHHVALNGARIVINEVHFDLISPSVSSGCIKLLTAFGSTAYAVRESNLRSRVNPSSEIWRIVYPNLGHDQPRLYFGFVHGQLDWGFVANKDVIGTPPAASKALH